jgi:hypothetical protein
MKYECTIAGIDIYSDPDIPRGAQYWVSLDYVAEKASEDDNVPTT